ncbi:MAG: hypothetical protein RMY27_24815 [Nostoc sp. DedQUE09]|nr:hypothetical protein [Nostoc sp. DedQUE09]
MQTSSETHNLDIAFVKESQQINRRRKNAICIWYFGRCDGVTARRRRSHSSSILIPQAVTQFNLLT